MKNNKYTISFIIIACLLFAFLPSMKVHGKAPSLKIDSDAVVLMDAKSGQVLYGENENELMYPASITKIATAIYAIETSNLNDLVTISENARNTEGTRVYLEPGEQVSLEKLIIGMLVNSGNDAAVAIAEHINGTVEKFSVEINQYLKEKVGVNSTHFVNPHGLFDKNHVTTAYDMAKITQYAMKNDKFKELFQIKSYDWVGESWETTILTHHRLLKGEFPYEGITGGKNGYVNKSGHTLTTTATKDNMDLIVVTLDSRKRDMPYFDTMALLDYGFENYKTELINKGEEFESNGKSYVVPDDFYYTIGKDEDRVEFVVENSQLKIINDSREVVTTLELEEIISVAVNKESAPSVKMESKNIDKNGGFKNVILILFTVICLVFVVYVIKFKRITK